MVDLGTASLRASRASVTPAWARCGRGRVGSRSPGLGSSQDGEVRGARCPASAGPPHGLHPALCAPRGRGGGGWRCRGGKALPAAGSGTGGRPQSPRPSGREGWVSSATGGARGPGPASRVRCWTCDSRETEKRATSCGFASASRGRGVWVQAAGCVCTRACVYVCACACLCDHVCTRTCACVRSRVCMHTSTVYE